MSQVGWTPAGAAATLQSAFDHPLPSFDIETTPNPAIGRSALGLEGDDAAVIREMMRRRSEETDGVKLIAREACSNLPKARSVLTCEVLRTYDAVLWLDADVTADDPQRLLEWAEANQHKRQVSVGLYPKKGGQHGWAADGVPTPMPSEPFQIENAGAGCMLIPRIVAMTVGERLPELIDQKRSRYRPIFFPIIDPPFELSEDFAFCRRCAAEGIPIVADPGVRLGHVRSCGVMVDWATGS